jgi:hypothetical protein
MDAETITQSPGDLQRFQICLIRLYILMLEFIIDAEVVQEGLPALQFILVIGLSKRLLVIDRRHGIIAPIIGHIAHQGMGLGDQGVFLKGDGVVVDDVGQTVGSVKVFMDQSDPPIDHGVDFLEGVL